MHSHKSSVPISSSGYATARLLTHLDRAKWEGKDIRTEMFKAIEIGSAHLWREKQHISDVRLRVIVTHINRASFTRSFVIEGFAPLMSLREVTPLHPVKLCGEALRYGPRSGDSLFQISIIEVNGV